METHMREESDAISPFFFLRGGEYMFTRRRHSFIVRMVPRCTAITERTDGLGLR